MGIRGRKSESVLDIDDESRRILQLDNAIRFLRVYADDKSEV